MSPEPPRTCLFILAGPLGRSDLADVGRRFCALLERDAAPVAVCDARGLAADAVAVDALARIHVVARRHGRRVLVRHASDDLGRLAALMGLAGALGVEPRGQAEEREEELRVEEEGELGQPPA